MRRQQASASRGSVLLVGVGGQGVVLASAIVADAALRSGHDVKQSEVHGMSQRGGMVSSHLRYGPAVASPLIEAGQADVVVAMEWNEGLRALPYLRPGRPLIVNLHRVVPPSACRERLFGRFERLEDGSLGRRVVSEPVTAHISPPHPSFVIPSEKNRIAQSFGIQFKIASVRIHGINCSALEV